MARVATCCFCDVDMHPPAKIELQIRRPPGEPPGGRSIQEFAVAVQAPEMDRTPPGVHMPINIRDLVNEVINVEWLFSTSADSCQGRRLGLQDVVPIQLPQPVRMTPWEESQLLRW